MISATALSFAPSGPPYEPANPLARPIDFPHVAERLARTFQFNSTPGALWVLQHQVMAAFAEAELASGLDIQFLTKRISNVAKMVPAHWPLGRWPRHIGLMITVVDQSEADRDIPRLLRLKQEFNIPWIGLSIEPMLGPIDLRFIERPNAGFGPYWLDALSGQAGWFADESATRPDHERRRCP